MCSKQSFARLAAIWLTVWTGATCAAWGQSAEEVDVEQTRPASGDNREYVARQQPEVAAGIVRQTNQFRQQQDLKPVETNSELTQAAEYFAAYMARTSRYGHTADGNRPAGRAKQHGYEYCIVLENIAYLYSSRAVSNEELTRRFVEGWQQSPGHRKNMLDPDVTETGVAVAPSEQSGYHYAVQMFGRPASASIEFEIANQSGSEIEYTIGQRSFTLAPRYTRTHERCRPLEVLFDWPASAKQQGTKIRPQDGDSFSIVQAVRGEFEIRQSATE